MPRPLISLSILPALLVLCVSPVWAQQYEIQEDTGRRLFDEAAAYGWDYDGYNYDAYDGDTAGVPRRRQRPGYTYVSPELRRMAEGGEGGEGGSGDRSNDASRSSQPSGNRSGQMNRSSSDRGRDAGQRDRDRSEPRERLSYWTQDDGRRWVSGQVVRRGRATPRSGGEARRVVMLAGRDGRRQFVDLGPMSRLRADVQKGDELEAGGRMTTRRNGQQVLLAREYELIQRSGDLPQRRARYESVDWSRRMGGQ